MTEPLTPPLIIAQLLGAEDSDIIDCVSFRDRTQLQSWIGRADIQPGDMIVFKTGGRLPATQVDKTNVTHLHPRKDQP